MEWIIGAIVASGLLGLMANFLVSGAKKLRDLGALNMNPRVWAAFTSLLLAVATILAGGDVDPNEVTLYLEVIAMWLGTWAVAHFMHKVNAV